MWPRRTADSTSGGGLGACGVASPDSMRSGWDGAGEAGFHPLGGGDVLRHAELLRLEAEGQRDQLWEVENGEAEVAAGYLRRLGLLHVQVEVAEGARGDQAVGAGVERVGDVGAGLAQRRVAVHGDHREAAAL